MNQTTNYNFNVPVGSDIVNPLVQDFPNWETLDTILRNVANTGITTATHTKTGTIHTLTFSETTVPMIRFQATADFNTNDTFTVNGLSVSALTVSGAALPDGAFVIGSMVLCELRDNLLTVYTSGTDADTLEGHPASYFATASDLQTVDDKADANKVLIDQINDDLALKLDVSKLTNSEQLVNGSVFNDWSIDYSGFNKGDIIRIIVQLTNGTYLTKDLVVGSSLPKKAPGSTKTVIVLESYYINGTTNAYCFVECLAGSILKYNSLFHNGVNEASTAVTYILRYALS